MSKGIIRLGWGCLRFEVLHIMFDVISKIKNKSVMKTDWVGSSWILNNWAVIMWLGYMFSKINVLDINMELQVCLNILMWLFEQIF